MFKNKYNIEYTYQDINTQENITVYEAGRDFIGIEKEPDIFTIAKHRIEEAQNSISLNTL